MARLTVLLIALLIVDSSARAQQHCPKGQDLVGGHCAPMCWQDTCDVAIPCGSRVSSGISITDPKSACVKHEQAIAANQGCPLGSHRKNTNKGCYSCVVAGNPKMCLEYEDGFFSKDLKIKCGTGRWTSCPPKDSTSFLKRQRVRPASSSAGGAGDSPAEDARRTSERPRSAKQ